MEPTSKHRSSFWDTIKEAFSGRRKLWILLILVLGFLAWRGIALRQRILATTKGKASAWQGLPGFH